MYSRASRASKYNGKLFAQDFRESCVRGFRIATDIMPPATPRLHRVSRLDARLTAPRSSHDVARAEVTKWHKFMPLRIAAEAACRQAQWCVLRSREVHDTIGMSLIIAEAPAARVQISIEILSPPNCIVSGQTVHRISCIKQSIEAATPQHRKRRRESLKSRMKVAQK